MYYIGIDPGAVSGAWGIIDHNNKYISCGDIPHIDGRILTIQFKVDLQKAIDGHDFHFIVERVHSFSGQGVASTFKFGRAVGAIEAVVDSFWHLYEGVYPQVWKKDLGLTSDKEGSLVMARELWPEAPLSRKKDHGKAEALLIAHYFQR